MSTKSGKPLSSTLTLTSTATADHPQLPMDIENESTRTRIAIIGAGAVARLFAARLLDAASQLVAVNDERPQIVLVTRFPQTAFDLRQRGIRLLKTNDPFNAPNSGSLDLSSEHPRVEAYAWDTLPDNLKPFDYVLVCTRAQHVPDFAKKLARLLKSMPTAQQLHDAKTDAERRALWPTQIVEFQNGVETLPLLESLYPQRVVGCAAWVQVTTLPAYSKGTAVEQAPSRKDAKPTLVMGMRHEFGSYAAGSVPPVMERLCSLLTVGGFNVKWTADIWHAKWKKLAFMVPYSALCTLFDCPAGEIQSSPNLAPVVDALAREVINVAALNGAHVQLDDAADARDLVYKLPPTSKPSLAVEFERKHFPSELDATLGAVVRFAQPTKDHKQLQIPTVDIVLRLLEHRERVLSQEP